MSMSKFVLHVQEKVCPTCPGEGLSCMSRRFVLHVQKVCPACPAVGLSYVSCMSRRFVLHVQRYICLPSAELCLFLSVLCRKSQESEPLLPPIGAASHRQQRTAALAEPDASSATGCQRLSPVPASEASDIPVTLLDTVLHVFSVLPEGLWWLWGCPRNFRPATDFFGVNILCITRFSVVLGDCSLILIGLVLSPNK